jgi:DNA modification methylase
VKSTAQQGLFYRNQHQLIGLYRIGNAPHLACKSRRHARSRSNLWRYAEVRSFGGIDELRSHCATKPVALIADAMKDCSNEGEIVFDPFAGSGTTMLAAERVGRRARALELDPRLVDLCIRRWQALTGEDAVHAESGSTFDQIATEGVQCTVATKGQ